MASKHKFHSLKPASNADLGIYEEAFDFATKSKGIRNIAVSGPYGAGKSSIVNSYFAVHKELKPVWISLAHFNLFEEDSPKQEGSSAEAKIAISKEQKEVSAKIGRGESEDENELEKRLEGEIINQLIQKAKPNALIGSRFRRRPGLQYKKMLGGIALLLIWLLSLIALWRWGDWSSWILSSFSAAEPLASPIMQIALFAIAIAGVGALLFLLVFEMHGGRLLKSVALKGCSIELFQETGESYFNKYLDEVLYLFRNSGYRMFIFEDLDRFNNMKIFEQLRKANDLLGEDIRFFYLVRDGLFTERERVKFFDFIIPVVPYIEGSNTYDAFMDLIDRSGKDDHKDDSFLRPTDQLLRSVLLYVNDMRVLKNIENEYCMYFEKLVREPGLLMGKGASAGGEPAPTSDNALLPAEWQASRIPDKLYSMVLYKNLYPSDYDKLIDHSGALHYVLHEYKGELVEAITNDIAGKITDLQGKLAAADAELLESEAEIDAVFAHYDAVVGGKYRSSYASPRDYFAAIRSEKDYPNTSAGRGVAQAMIRSKQKEAYDQRLSNITLKDKAKRSKLMGEIEKLREQRAEVSEQQLVDLLLDKEGSVEGLQAALTERGISEKVELLTRLVSLGMIAEDYPSYCSYFFEGRLSKGDQKFVLDAFVGRRNNYDYPITNINEVINHLSTLDFKRSTTLNYDIVHHLVEMGDSEKLNLIACQITKHQHYRFLFGYIEKHDDAYQLVKLVNKDDPETYDYMSVVPECLHEDVEEYGCICIERESRETILAINKRGKLSKALGGSSTSLLRLSREPGRLNEILDRLEDIQVKFKHLTSPGINSDLLDGVYARGLFAITVENIAFLLARYHGIDLIDWSCCLTTIRSIEGEPLAGMIEDDPSSFMAVVLGQADVISDEQETVVFLLAAEDPSFDDKVAYIAKMTSELDDISGIADVKIYEELLSQGLVAFTEDNMLELFRVNGHELKGSALSFFNESDGFTFSFSSAKDDELVQLLAALMKAEGVKLEPLESTFEDCGRVETAFSIPNLEDDRLSAIIRSGYIAMNEDNLTFFEKNYKPHLLELIESEPAQFAELVADGHSVSSDEVVEILNSDEICTEEKKSIASAYALPISVTSLDQDDELWAFILENNYCKDDLWEVIDLYEGATPKLKKAVEKRVLESIDEVIEKADCVPSDLLFSMIETEALSDSERQALLDAIEGSNDQGE